MYRFLVYQYLMFVPIFLYNETEPSVMKVIGIDEAGRGPVIGPMVMAAVLIEDDAKLRDIGVKDSKMLRPKEREDMYDRIVSAVRDYDIIITSPTEIDAALKDPKSNLNWLEADKMIELAQKLKPDKVIADCPSTNIKAFTNYLKKELKMKLVLEHKADENHPVVAAASILAKVTRDRSIENLKKIYGDFGSGYLTDQKTQEFLNRQYDLPIFRKSWVSWKRVDERMKQRTLGDF